MIFNEKKADSRSRARTGTLINDHGIIETPVFMPVGTVGVVKTFSPEELEYFNSQIILYPLCIGLVIPTELSPLPRDECKERMNECSSSHGMH